MSTDPVRFETARLPHGVLRAALWAGIALLLTPSLAQALSSGGDAPTSAFGEVLCDAPMACERLTTPPEAAGFDFAFGARATASGLHLELESEGSVFLLGPVRASGDISLRTEVLEVTGSVATGDAIRVDVPDGRSLGDITLDARDIVLLDPDRLPTIRPVADPSVTPRSGSGGSITLRAGSGLQRVGDASVLSGALDGELRVSGTALPPSFVPGLLPSAATGSEATPPSAPSALLVWSLSVAGDVYLDLSGIELGSLDVVAKKRITVVDAGSAPVPEPTTALLLGLGLAGLAGRRAR